MPTAATVHLEVGDAPWPAVARCDSAVPCAAGAPFRAASALRKKPVAPVQKRT